MTQNLLWILEQQTRQIQSSTEGLLIPKMDKFPANPTVDQQGMMVYLTTSTGGKFPGFYYWDFPTLDWIGIASSLNFEVNSNNFEDFMFDDYAGAGKNDNQYSFTRSLDGDGTYSGIEGIVNTYVGGNDYAGRHILSTGTTVTGKAGLGSFNLLDRLRPGGKIIYYDIRVRIENLSNATDAFVAYFGLTDLVMTDKVMADFPPTNGIYFSYTHSSNSGQWIATSRSAGSSTDINSALAVSAGQWYKISALVYETANKVEFFIDEVLIGEATTNIPVIDLKFVFAIQKTAGTTARNASIDLISWQMVR